MQPPGPHGAGTTIQSNFLRDLRVHALDLPASRVIHHDAAVGELLERIAVLRATHAAPDLLRHVAGLVPVDELGRRRLVAGVDHRIAVGVENLRPHGHRQWREAMTAAVHRHRVGRLGSRGHLAGRFHPIVPRRRGAGHRHLGLLEQRLVDERAGDGELRHHAVDALVSRTGAQPLQARAEVVLPVLRARAQRRREIEVELVEPAEIGDARDVGAFACGKLHGQRLDDRLVRHLVDDHLAAGIARLEALGEVAQDFALVAVGIALHADFGGERGAGRDRKHCAKKMDALHDGYLLGKDGGRHGPGEAIFRRRGLILVQSRVSRSPKSEATEPGFEVPCSGDDVLCYR